MIATRVGQLFPCCRYLGTSKIPGNPQDFVIYPSLCQGNQALDYTYLRQQSFK